MSYHTMAAMLFWEIQISVAVGLLCCVAVFVDAMVNG